MASRSAESSFNIGGLRSQFKRFPSSTAWTITPPRHLQPGPLQPGEFKLLPDAVAEFKVITNSYSAEYGRVGGGVVNASVRSGTFNQVHGTVWEFYLLNTDLNATGFFKPVGGALPVYIQNHLPRR